MPEVVTANFVYSRLRMPEYSVEDRQEIAGRVEQLLGRGHDVYVFFKHEETPAGAFYAEELLKEFPEQARAAGLAASVFGLRADFCFGASASSATSDTAGFLAAARLFFSASMMSITLAGSACGGVTTSLPWILESINTASCRDSHRGISRARRARRRTAPASRPAWLPVL